MKPSLPASLVDDADARARTVARQPKYSGGDEDARSAALEHGVIGDVIRLDSAGAVETLIAESIEAGFAGAGYRIVDTAHPDAARAIPVEVELVEFWAWVGGENLHIAGMHVSAVVAIHAPIAPFERGRRVYASGTRRTFSANPGQSQWRNTIRTGADELAARVSELLAPAR